MLYRIMRCLQVAKVVTTTVTLLCTYVPGVVVLLVFAFLALDNNVLS